MKLSEAIREGAMLRPQIFGLYCGRNENLELCTCALGAACEAATGKLPTRENFNGGAVIVALEMVVGPIAPELYSKIIHWNDVDHLSRENIANLVEAEGL